MAANNQRQIYQISGRPLTVASDGAPVDGGGGSGDDGGMEARISALEAANLETRDRLARIETRLESVATKADLSELTSSFHREINAQTWRLVTFVCGFGTALVAATYFFAKHVN
ncbi:MAG: hypothetical protein PW999_09820 [Paraburkholderia tropica]|nr:hypothetical protein [Paraburkholderia tropica]